MSSHNATTTHEAHAHGAGMYHATLIALLILTALTVGASYIQFGSSAANVTIALTIATIKATLVGMIFMHLLEDKKVNAIIVLAGFLFLGIFLLFCLIDFNTRIIPSPRNLPNMEKATPVPDSLVPSLVPAPKPLPKAAPAEHEAEH
jgi:caa(3)-type oxidase subunit IV